MNYLNKTNLSCLHSFLPPHLSPLIGNFMFIVHLEWKQKPARFIQGGEMVQQRSKRFPLWGRNKLDVCFLVSPRVILHLNTSLTSLFSDFQKNHKSWAPQQWGLHLTGPLHLVCCWVRWTAFPELVHPGVCSFQTGPQLLGPRTVLHRKGCWGEKTLIGISHPKPKFS